MRRKFKVTVDGETFTVEVEEIESSKKEEGIHVSLQPPSIAPRQIRREERETVTHAADDLVVFSPMSGVISRIDVRVDDRVDAGTLLLVLEAMKMENEIKSSASGLIKEIYVEAGQRVGRGDRLILIS